MSDCPHRRTRRVGRTRDGAAVIDAQCLDCGATATPDLLGRTVDRGRGLATDGGDPLRDDGAPVARVFEQASAAVMDDRGETHGNIGKNFTQIADLWEAYLGIRIEPRDVAMLNVLQKVSRQECGSPDEDHFVDIAGYAAIANGLARSFEDGDSV